MSNNNSDIYQLELQKVDLMIGIWQEINRFSNRVLALHIDHRDSVYQMAKRNQLQSAPILTTNSNRNHRNHRNHSHHLISNGHSHSHTNLHSKHKQHYTSSESDSDEEHENESDELPNSKTTKNHYKNGSKKERKTTKGRCSGYNVYFGVRCKEIQRSDPNLEFAAISRNIGIEWKNLDKTAQQKWNGIAAKTTKQRKEETGRKKYSERDKKRKFTAMNGNNNRNIGENMNSMVTNVRIEDKMGQIFSAAPSHKRMRMDNVRNITTNNLLPMIATGTLAMLNQTQMPQLAAAQHQAHDMSKPALSLLSEALKKMPALQPDSNK